MVNDQTFELKAAVSISPTTGSVGDSIQIQMTDFPEWGLGQFGNHCQGDGPWRQLLR